jgi:hypothetical protein
MLESRRVSGGREMDPVSHPKDKKELRAGLRKAERRLGGPVALEREKNRGRGVG